MGLEQLLPAGHGGMREPQAISWGATGVAVAPDFGLLGLLGLLGLTADAPLGALVDAAVEDVVAGSAGVSVGSPESAAEAPTAAESVGATLCVVALSGCTVVGLGS